MSFAENRVVSLQFDNAAFERGISQTLLSIDNLSQRIDLLAARNAFDGINQSAANVNLQHIGAAVDDISQKFGAMGAVAFTTLQDITRSAIDAAQQIYSSTIGQVIEGGASRSLAIEQARFLFQGLGMDIEATMESALDAVRGTAYGLDEAATLAGVFGAAGIESGEQLTAALRGVAGAAAITGRGFSEIGAVFQNVAAIGHLTNNDLNSLALRGLGIGTIAERFNMTEEELRAAATASSISFEQFASTMDDAFGEHAQRANETYTGSLKNLRSALSRLGEDFQTPKFAALRPVFNALGPAIDGVAESLAPLVETWTQLTKNSSRRAVKWIEQLDFTTFTQIIRRISPMIAETFNNLRRAAKSFIEPFKRAISDILPERPAQSFARLGRAIADFTEHLILGEDTIKQLSKAFSGILAVGQIVWEVIKGVANVFVTFFQSISGVGSGLLTFGASAGDALVRLREFLVDGGAIQNFFQNLANFVSDAVDAFRESGVIEFFSDAIGGVRTALDGLFGGLDETDSAMGRLSQRFTDSGSSFQRVGDAIISGLNWVWDGVQSVIGYITEAFDGLGETIANSLSEGDFDEVVDVMNIGILGGLAAIFAQIMQSGVRFSNTSLDLINGTLARFNTTLTAMSIEIRAGALMKVAKAIGIMALSITLLSLVDSAALTRALSALAVGIGELMGSMQVMNYMLRGPFSAARLLGFVAGLGLLSAAIFGLSISVAMLAMLDWGELLRGLVGLAGILAIVVTAAGPLTDTAPGMIRAGLGMIAIGVALNIIGFAVKRMSSMSWDELVRGLVGVGVALGGMVLAMNQMPTAGMVRAGIAMFAMSLGLNAIATAVMLMSTMDWEDMRRGLIGLGAALISLVAAANIMQGSIGGAIAIFIMSTAMMALSSALTRFGDMSWDELIHGLVGMAAALGVIGLAAWALSGVIGPIALLGLALIPLSIGLGLFGRALSTISEMSWGELAKSILFLSLALGALAAVAYAIGATGAVAAMAALGGALLLIGGAIALVGVGLYFMARMVEVLLNAGEGVLQFIMDLGRALISMIPEIAVELAEGFVAFLDIVLAAAPEIIEGLVTVLGDLIDAIIELTPQLAEAIGVIIQELARIIVEHGPTVVAAGVNLILALLRGIRDNIATIVVVVTDLISRFLNALSNHIGRVVNAGINFIVSFINGLSRGIPRIVNAVVNLITRFIGALANGAGRIVTAGTNMIVNILTGIGNSIQRVITAGTNVIIQFMNGVSRAVPRLVRAGFNAVINMLNGIADAIRNRMPELLAAGANIGDAIIDGLLQGLSNGAGQVMDFVRNLAGNAVDAVTGFLGINSPSKVFIGIGESISEGLALGIGHHENVISGIYAMGDAVVSEFNNVSARAAAAISNMDGFNPTITPVLDLSAVEERAQDLNNLFGANAVVADLSTQRAQVIAAVEQANVAVSNDPFGPAKSSQVTFEQNIYSPTALSVGDVYRQTKNQIALAKEELSIS